MYIVGCQLNYLRVFLSKPAGRCALPSLLVIWFCWHFSRAVFRVSWPWGMTARYTATIWLQPVHSVLKFLQSISKNSVMLILFSINTFHPWFILATKQVLIPLRIMSTSQATKGCWPIHSRTYHQYLGEICFSKLKETAP